MKREIKEIREFDIAAQTNAGAVCERFGKGWGTDLERKLAELSYPMLNEAFNLAAKILDRPEKGVTVAFCVKSAKSLASRTSLQDSDWYNAPTKQIFEDFRSSVTNLPWLSDCLAMTVFVRLWSFSSAMECKAKRLPTRQIVTKVTAICLLAERARNVLHTEQRVEEWHRLARSGKLLATKPRERPATEARRKLGRQGIRNLERWHKNHRHEFATTSEAATTFLQSTIHPFDPMYLHELLESGETRTEQIESVQIPLR